MGLCAVAASSPSCDSARAGTPPDASAAPDAPGGRRPVDVAAPASPLVRLRSDASRDVRTAFRLVTVKSLIVAGDNAQGRVIWSARGGEHAHFLSLARVHGIWRVTDDRPTGSR